MARINHAVVRSRGAVADGPDIALVVESLTVPDHVSNIQNGQNADGDRELDVAMLVSVNMQDLAHSGWAWPMLERVVDTLWLLCG